ncbi:ABC transporter ATP-binding protein [Caldiplasma sukawensis]
MSLSLEAKNLSKNYGKFKALKNFNLSIDQGEFVVVLGPNGAGKSTFFKISTNIIKPTTGELLIKGINVSNDPMNALKLVGPLIELPEFYPYLKGFDIIYNVCRIKGANKQEAEKEVKSLSSLLRMDSFIESKCGGYSRGMKQRLALACAFAMDPEILILDEPTFGLDPSGMREFSDIINRKNKKEGKTVIMSTHLVSEARELADRVIILNNGEIAADITNLKDVRVVKLTFDQKMPDEIDGSLGRITGKKDLSMEIEVKDGISNMDLIESFKNKGYDVKWVEPTNVIEKKYIETIGWRI